MSLQHARQSTTLVCSWSAEVQGAGHVRGAIQVLSYRSPVSKGYRRAAGATNRQNRIGIFDLSELWRNHLGQVSSG